MSEIEFYKQLAIELEKDADEKQQAFLAFQKNLYNESVSSIASASTVAPISQEDFHQQSLIIANLKAKQAESQQLLQTYLVLTQTQASEIIQLQTKFYMNDNNNEENVRLRQQLTTASIALIQLNRDSKGTITWIYKL